MAAVRRLKLPAMVEGGLTDDNAGGLVSLSPSGVELNRQFAGVVDRILKGANPGAVPIEQPTRFVLSLDLRTAKTLGITVPQSLLLRADEVIQ
jgi:putative ABC transport system substrate-binding protein